MSGAYAVVRYPSGRLVNATLLPENGSYTAVLPAAEEGEYSVKVYARDAAGNVGTLSTSYSFSDRPRIERVEYTVEDTIITFNITARDTSGIGGVRVEAYGTRYTAEPVSVDQRGNGVYSAEIPIQAPEMGENVSYTVTVFDANGLSTTRHGSLALTLPLRGNIIYLFRGGEKG